MLWGILSLFFTIVSTQAQEVDNRKFKITKIEFLGLKFYDEKQALAACDLRLGQEIDMSGLKAATSRLLKSGLFRRANYHYNSVDDQIEIAFEVQEVRSAPCIFDNFIWFDNQEITAAIKQSLPNFAGQAPENDLVILRIKEALRKLLQEKNLPGQIQYVYANESEEVNSARHIFSVTSPAPQTCTATFEGASAGRENELKAAAKALLNTEYSLSSAKNLATQSILPIYLRQGFLQAQILRLTVKPENSNKCNNGAAIVIQIKEGQQYLLDTITWNGNQILPTQTLGQMIGLNAGDVANSEKIEAGIKAALKSYLKAGYLEANIKPRLLTDDTKARASYEFTVAEGIAFKMGEFDTSSLTENEAKKVGNNWKLKAGDVFDAVYFSEFLEKKTEDLKLRQQGKRLNGQLLPNRQNQTIGLKFMIVDL